MDRRALYSEVHSVTAPTYINSARLTIMHKIINIQRLTRHYDRTVECIVYGETRALRVDDLPSVVTEILDFTDALERDTTSTR